MTRGALFFAYNTAETDYVRLAEFSARRVKKWLGIPSTLITDSDIKSNCFENIIFAENNNSSMRYFEDRGCSIEWRNFGRNSAFYLSPYDQTLLLDVDYIIDSDRLLSVMNSSYDFLCHDSAIDVTGIKGNNKTFGRFNMPMSWATVIVFNKTHHSKSIFEIMKMVEENYEHYGNLYGFSPSPFRNDYALSIALSVVSGHVVDKTHSIPWPMINVYPENSVTIDETDCFEIEYIKRTRTGERLCKNTISNQDLHIMGKSYLEAFVEASC